MRTQTLELLEENIRHQPTWCRYRKRLPEQDSICPRNEPITDKWDFIERTQNTKNQKQKKKKQPLQKMGQGPEQRTLRRRKKWLRTISKNVHSPQQLEKCKPNNSEISSHLSQDGKAHHHYQKQKLESMQAKGNPELWTGRATMAISMQNCQPAQNKDATWPSCTTS